MHLAIAQGLHLSRALAGWTRSRQLRAAASGRTESDDLTLSLGLVQSRTYDPLIAHLPPIFQEWHGPVGSLHFGMNMTPLGAPGVGKTRGCEPPRLCPRRRVPRFQATPTLAAGATMPDRGASRTPPSKTLFRRPSNPGEPRPVWICGRRRRSTPVRSVQNELEIWRQTPESAEKPCGVRLRVSPNDLENAGDTGDKSGWIVTVAARFAAIAGPVPSGADRSK